MTNRAFLARAIAKAQHLVLGDTFCNALHAYIKRNTQVLWDDARALFWVQHPFEGYQVAIWLMPIASLFEPIGKEAA
jgi:hypothetical protein